MNGCAQPVNIIPLSVSVIKKNKHRNSNLVYSEFSAETLHSAKEIVPFSVVPTEDGFKYLGFFLKPNSYSFQDWVLL